MLDLLKSYLKDLHSRAEYVMQNPSLKERKYPRQLGFQLRFIVLLALVISAGTGSMPGCASWTRSGDEIMRADAPPDDFAVSILVPANGALIEPAWYILEADGTLRAALGEATSDTPIPPRVRTLTPGARAEVWNAVLATGWIPSAEAATAEEVGSGIVVQESTSTTAAGETARIKLADVYVAAGGGRWSGRVVDVPGSAAQGSLATVIARLRALAWLPIDGA